MSKIHQAVAAVLVMAAGLAACSGPELAPHMRPLSKDAMMLLGKKGMKVEAPIFVRVFKEESELEVWKQRDDGRFYHFKTYPICMWSGGLGPKLRQGDKQAPEGFYTIHKGLMNPKSSFHLAFNLGYPNAYDRVHNRTGDFLMVHGKCVSAGCYAMTDGLVEEIYALARDQFAAGHKSFEVHAFPFRMTAENMARHKGSPWQGFWATLKEGYDHFETTRQVPAVAVCERRYLVNPQFKRPLSGKLDPAGRCPAYEKGKVEAFVPRKGDTVAELPPVVVPGRKMRTLLAEGASPAAGTASGAPMTPIMGLGMPIPAAKAAPVDAAQNR